MIIHAPNNYIIMLLMKYNILQYWIFSINENMKNIKGSCIEQSDFHAYISSMREVNFKKNDKQFLFPESAAVPIL